MCAEAFRSHIESVSRLEINWFPGIKDPIAGRAIAAIHFQLDEDWFAQTLADVVAMSPSRFAARFSEAVGDSPVVYATKWRTNVASKKLINTQNRIDQIGTNVGYESQAAFSRAFKMLVGVLPAIWRTNERKESEDNKLIKA